VVALLACAGPAATARAGTVEMRVVRSCGDACPQLGEQAPLARVELRGAPGERNDVTLAREGGAVAARDEGAPLAAGAGCEQVDEHRARCRLGAPVYELDVDLGDMGDSAALLAPLGTTADGAFRTRITGGPGDDVIAVHNGGADRVACRGGVDEVAPDRADLLLPDCEFAVVAGRRIAAQPFSVMPARIVFARPCVCRGMLKLRAGGRELGRAPVRPWRRVVVPLRRRLARGKATRVTLSWALGSAGRRSRKGGYRVLARPQLAKRPATKAAPPGARYTVGGALTRRSELRARP
jgi:hypothetical protein